MPDSGSQLEQSPLTVCNFDAEQILVVIILRVGVKYSSWSLPMVTAACARTSLIRDVNPACSASAAFSFGCLEGFFYRTKNRSYTSAIRFDVSAGRSRFEVVVGASP
jgi:hypothetical protein